ncbi:xin actin-binding repeat-containing protein 1 isoform X2 [Elgaria multicarinata webbii]|uniref:xin actin-binding repeat-containing protein 1 isoform X2 n=1 Tax=Elgaria multicarinata webbii TaxID=159646 RepID=UPI002FCD283A
MAEAQNDKSPKATIKKAEEDLPPPPPPPPQDSAPAPTSATGNQESNPLPVPPPKESFSKFYQQRQVNELKRLYRHMHPELRKNLEEAVTEDLAEMLSTDDPNAPASVNLDAVLPGEVQSMRWIFENWTLDSIGERQAAKKLAEEEDIPSGDVKNRSMRFESQPANGERLLASAKTSEKEHTTGDVHTARWLFETQPLDSLNKMYLEETDLQEAVLKEPIQRGDVKGAAQLFETHSLDALGRCSSVEEQSILQLKSEIQELKGDVKKTIKLFQTEPLCAIRDKTGNIHEIKSVCREEIQSNAVKTARWLFETQPLDTINKDTSKVQVIRGISLEEVARGSVSGAKWLFETQPLDAIREFNVEESDFKASPDLIQGTDVSKQCLLFETHPLDILKGEASDSIPAKEEVIKGDVKSTLWLFETQPMEVLKDNFEVGHLKKVELLDEEKGAVKQTKHVFETCPLGSISKPPPEDFASANIQEVEKGDVKAFKSLFETLPLDSIRQVSTEEAVKEGEEIPPGNVKANQFLFETTPLYAIKDCLGNFHKVTSVSREEEVTSGDVKNYKWMFETKPLDQFEDSNQKVDIIRGITKQEVVAGDVKTAKWLFETQPINVIHSQMNQEEQNVLEKGDVPQGGDVKTRRWLFETHPIDALYEKDEKKQDSEESVPCADVKSCTWMFETRPLDSLKGQEEQYLQVSKSYRPDELQGVDVKTVRHLFETEPLINSIADDVDSKKIIRYSSRVEIQSGEVSRVKEFFEAKPLDSADKTCKATKETDFPTDGNIEPGAVHKFTWLFENCPMDTLKSSMEGIQEMPPEKDIQGGDVGGKRFVFETYSLGQIHDKENEVQIEKIQEETTNKASVKSCTMLFETQPLYAIQDKDGGYHEVTSVKKEEVMKGDVKGARWQFETKPLDQIKKNEEVFVIRAVTQEDFRKGDVQAARWRFETEPLDSISDEKTPVLRTVDDVQKGDVRSNKQLFESEQLSQKKYVRMVSVSDVQQGDVRTSTWLFENQPIDSLKGELESTSNLSTVQRENIHKGDVKRCTWLFETQPMDSLKDTEASASAEPLEVVPGANVKSTTWLFESTPLDELNTSQYCAEMEGKKRTIAYTLEVLFCHRVIQHGGILIEANDTESVKMAKYHLGSQASPEIQKEEVMGGNLQRILLQLLQRTNVEAQGVLVEEEANGDIKISPVQLLEPSKAEKSQEDLRDDVAKILQGFLSQEDASVKKGIIMQETETGTVKMTIYSLLRCVAQQHGFVKGDVKSTLGSLMASSQEHRATATVRREDNERGNVQLYTSCIEKGDLDYLKHLQRESEIESLVSSQTKEEPLKTVQEVVVPAKVEEGKVVTTADVLLGTSSGAKRALLGESKDGSLEREAVHASDRGPTLHCLGPSPPPVIARENVVAGNAELDIQMVQKAQNGSHRVVAREEIISPWGRKEGTDITKGSDQKDDMAGVIHCSTVGGINQITTQPKMQTPGSDLQAAMQSLRLATAEAQSLQHQVRSKLQKTTGDIQLSGTTVQPPAVTMPSTGHKEGCAATKPQQASNVTFIRVQETSQKSQAKVSQKSTASHAKLQ